MDRRAMLGTLGVGALGLTALSSREAEAQIQAPANHAKLESLHKECLEACADGARACDMTYHHCLVEVSKGKAEHAKPLQYVVDCAGFCALSACNIAKLSPLMSHSCEACAEACKDTLAVLSKFDSTEMKAAVKALEKCERSCRTMLAAMGHHH